MLLQPVVPHFSKNFPFVKNHSSKFSSPIFPFVQNHISNTDIFKIAFQIPIYPKSLLQCYQHFTKFPVDFRITFIVRKDRGGSWSVNRVAIMGDQTPNTQIRKENWLAIRHVVLLWTLLCLILCLLSPIEWASKIYTSHRFIRNDVMLLKKISCTMTLYFPKTSLAQWCYTFQNHLSHNDVFKNISNKIDFMQTFYSRHHSQPYQ